jgi:hypothetical protein
MLWRGNVKKVFLLCPLLVVLFLPGFPWSPRLHHLVKKIVRKAEAKVRKWQGYEPHLVAIAGVTSVPGARVQALDSLSGWATLCDREGKFTLPGVLWYPGATFELIFSTEDGRGSVAKVYAPSTLSASGVIDAGTVVLNSQDEVDLPGLPGIGSISYQNFDLPNRDYYRRIFDEITGEKLLDEERVDAINQYLAARLNYEDTQVELGSPRRILEGGSPYCGHLSITMATMLAPTYPVRVIDMTDAGAAPNTHVVVEVFYDKDWHLFDPTFGVKFPNQEGRVLSYRELRLNPELVSIDAFSRFQQKYPEVSLHSLVGIYRSGHHHYYYLSYKCSQYAHAWVAYRNGLNYVPAGGRIMLACAGIRAGTKVTYHIRKPGSNQDELTFTSQRGAKGIAF